GTVVTTGAPFGKSGMWLIDPADYIIAPSGGDITGAQLGSNLNSTPITIASTDGTVQTSGNGDIFVNDAVSWGSSSSLTLTALRDVNVNSSITSSGGGTVSLFAGWDGISSAVAPTLTSGIGTIRINAPVAVSNFGPAAIAMSAGGAIVVNSSITATAGGSS